MNHENSDRRLAGTQREQMSVRSLPIRTKSKKPRSRFGKHRSKRSATASRLCKCRSPARRRWRPGSKRERYVVFTVTLLHLPAAQ